MKHKTLLALSLCLSAAFLLVSAPTFAKTDPNKLKEHMESCEQAVEDLTDAGKEFGSYVAGVKKNIAKPVDEQDELSAKDWTKLITGPKSQAWREEKDKLKAAIKQYEKSCKGITKKIKNMDKPQG